KFPQTWNCRGSRPPAGCTRLVRGCSFRKAARNFRKPGISEATALRPGVQGLFVGVVSEKPPEISAATIFRGTIILQQSHKKMVGLSFLEKLEMQNRKYKTGNTKQLKNRGNSP
ncbi:MAG: hypothetical protein PUD05_02995, partial [Lachnospiraceae bacterium]|nr:hypothetical protein [Lachnospiraceae bacterium]